MSSRFSKTDILFGWMKERKKKRERKREKDGERGREGGSLTLKNEQEPYKGYHVQIKIRVTKSIRRLKVKWQSLCLCKLFLLVTVCLTMVL